MGYRYESLEDGQVIETDEPREDLDVLARWKRSDVAAPAPAPTSVGATNPDPVAGPVNTSPVTGGTPPLTSTSAGFSDPSEIISQAEALRRAQEAAGGSGDTSEPPAGDPGTETGTGTGDQSEGIDEPVRPGLNGSTEEWLAFAKHASIALDVADDASRDDIIAAYIKKFAPAGNGSGEDWAAYAEKHGVTVADDAGRDKIRAAVIEAGWAKA
jgi:hypothetical protein